MEIVRLEDICDIVTGTTPSKNKKEYWDKREVPFITPADLKYEGINYIKARTFLSKKGASIGRIIPKNSIIVCCIGSIGKLGINTQEVITNQQLNSIILKTKDIDLMYFYFYLKSLKNEMEKMAASTTVKIINKSSFGKIEIELPDIVIQRKIGKILKNICEIIEIKNKKLIELENLSKCLFIKMFGDLNFKHKAWERKKFSELCQINPSKNEIKELEDNIEVSFIPMSAVSIDGIVNVAEKAKLKKVKTGFTYFKENDVLFAKITPCMENGKGGIAKNLKNEIGFGSTEFHVLRPLKNISTSYWLYYVTMLPQFRKSAENMMTGSGGQKRVPSSYFETLKINIPPIELQNRFAERVKLIEKSKFLLLNFLKVQDLRIFKVEL